VKPATTREVEIPAQYQTQKVNKMVEPAYETTCKFRQSIRLLHEPRKSLTDIGNGKKWKDATLIRIREQIGDL
jgi:hypothetical protein